MLRIWRFASVAIAMLCCPSRHRRVFAFLVSSTRRFGGSAFLFGKRPCDGDGVFEGFGQGVANPRRRARRVVSTSWFSGGVALFSAASGDPHMEDESKSGKGQGDDLTGRFEGNLRILGVCGGIGSGKSLVCKLLVSELGCVAHIDADKLAHGVYAPGSLALGDIAEEFGSAVLGEDGDIDRKMLGSIVFADPDAMSRLESIVWPHTRALLISRLEEIANGLKQGQVVGTVKRPAFVVVEAAVLLDAGWDDLFDAIWVIKAPRTTTTDRLVSDRGMDGQDAFVRIDAQESRRGIGNLEEEVASGSVNAVIENGGTIEDLTSTLAEKLSDPSSWKDGIPVKPGDNDEDQKASGRGTAPVH